MTKSIITILTILIASLFFWYFFNQQTENQIGATDLENLTSQITTDLQPNGKYKRVAPYTLNGITYEVNEYETSKGEYGYQIRMTQEFDEVNGTSTKVIKTKSIGYGVDAARWTWDWR